MVYHTVLDQIWYIPISYCLVFSIQGAGGILMIREASKTTPINFISAFNTQSNASKASLPQVLHNTLQADLRYRLILLIYRMSRNDGHPRQPLRRASLKSMHSHKATTAPSSLPPLMIPLPPALPDAPAQAPLREICSKRQLDNRVLISEVKLAWLQGIVLQLHILTKSTR
jgi:hypothetical protein